MNKDNHAMTHPATKPVPAIHPSARVIPFTKPQPNSEFCLSAAAEKCLAHYFKQLQGMTPAPNLYDLIIAEVERPLLQHVLAYAKGNQLRAAAILGINRNTLRKKLTDLNLSAKPRLAR